MNEFFRVRKSKKTIKTLNLDDFSFEDLNQYIHDFKNGIYRVKRNRIKILIIK